MPVYKRDVSSLSKSGSAKLKGDVTLSEGSNVTLTQSGNDISIASTGGAGGGTVDTVVAGSNIDVDATDPANPIVSVETLTLADVSDITATATEVNYTDGVTSAIQTQIDGKQPLDSDLTTIAGLTATTDNVIQSSGSAWASRTPAQLKATLALAKGDVGLGNVDNTSDATKNSASATLTNKTISGSDNTISNISPSQRTGGFYIGTIPAATLSTTGNKAITGVGFTPKLVRFTLLAGADSSNQAVNATGAMTAASQFVQMTAAASTPATRRQSSTSHCLGYTQTGASALLLASYVSMDADGFTINVGTATASSFAWAFEAYA